MAIKHFQVSAHWFHTGMMIDTRGRAAVDGDEVGVVIAGGAKIPAPA
jgi:hypothetical protein